MCRVEWYTPRMFEDWPKIIGIVIGMGMLLVGVVLALRSYSQTETNSEQVLTGMVIAVVGLLVAVGGGVVTRR